MSLLDTIAAPAAGRADLGRSRSDARRVASVWSARAFMGVIAFLLVFLVAAYARWRFADSVVPWDSKNHFYPMFRFLGDGLAHGSIPLWNPYHFSGYPAVADPQSMIFTPSMLLFALVAPNASMPVFDAVILAHIFFGGVGVICLARRWGWHPLAAMLCALVFMFGGAASSRLEHTGMIISYIYFPWALFALQSALARRSLRLAALAGLAIALMALGRDQVAFMLCLGLLGAVLRETMRADSPLDYVRSRLPVLLCTGAITLCCMIVPILLTLQFVHDSNRPSITYGVALSGSLSPINLLTLFAPDVFGSLDRTYDYWGPGTGLIAGNDWTDKTDRTIDYMFVGTVPFVLLVWHGIAGGRLLERRAAFVFGLFALALVYAFGRHTPVFSLIFDWVPGVSLYRRPADANFAINVTLALGAGYLLDRFITDGLPRAKNLPARWLSVALPAAILLAVAILIAGGLTFARRYAHLDESLLQLALAGGMVSAVVLLLVLFRGPRTRPTVAALLVAATAAELLWRHAASALNAEPISTYSAYNGFYPDEARGLAVLRDDIARRAADGERPRVELIGVNGSWQNAALVLKLEDTIGYNPLRISDYERAVGPVESAIDIDLRQFPGLFRGYTGRLAALLGLDYLVLDRPLDRLPRHFPRPQADLLFAGNGFYVYRLLYQSVARAAFVDHVIAVDSDAVIADERMPDFDPSRSALIDAADVASLRQPALLRPPEPKSSGPNGSGPDESTPGHASITAYEDNAVTIAVEAAQPGIVVLHDLAYPGWTVSVDGQTKPLLRADILFRGVEVSAGHHVVVFRFEPLTLANLSTAAGSLMRKRPR